MALEGQLSDFSLEEILQLIAVQQKSGFLVLSCEQEMIFYFDRGVLISTRDRRTRENDPLERYLRRYGFLSDEQWRHIEYILGHSSFDLSEVLISEHLMVERELTTILQAVAQELIHEGMKIKRGSYHFTATADVHAGIRGRINMDIQGLLMEGARRQDEEQHQLERLASAAQTFQRGTKPPAAGELGEIGQRVLELALAGEPLERILARARASAFTVRELLLHLCESGALVPVEARQGEATPFVRARVRQADARGVGRLRQPAVFLLLVLVILGVGALRWRPLPAAGGPPAASGAANNGAGAGDVAAAVRLAQLQQDVVLGLDLFRHQYGKLPADLSLLVKAGFLPASTVATLEARGWRYAVTEKDRSYQLGP